ncbi:DNA-protecting protein DprA [Neisseria zalophi]|uniref:DNA-protecting protein DprA n=1 Tax=Neisseria zalophi TaxID=640030 RepID=A0A5J6PTI7_9NEIS|nr:DNA-processing protein DprA [Neisseria zalophi]QEY25676.1 DNA-protecting protein DprA [Neisseria zalophi]
MIHSERFAWAQLALTPYIGPESFLALIQHYGSAQAALAAPAEAVSKLVRHKQAVEAWKGKNGQAIAAAEAAFTWEKQKQCRLMLLCDNDFPTMLTEGITPPPLLFLRGCVELLQQPAIAIVGSRHATPQALRIAHDFGKAISKHDIPVVSGMASGIDTAAHQGALSENGGTIAVWGTGIDRIYPQSNRDLAYQIAEKGLIISEFPLGTRPLAGNFPRRNRLIAALSKAVLVVEAAPESGSLITARLAGEMGREVMAVPGSIDNPHSKGCHKLIKEGAKLVECLDDILSECPSLSKPAPVKHIVRQNKPVPKQAPDNMTETKPSENPILTALGYGPTHPDNLAQTLNMPTADIYAQLLELELDNIVASLPGGRYQRIK